MKYADITTRLADLGSAKWDIHLRAKDRIARGERIISLTIGEPDVPTPEALLVAANAAMMAGRTGYSNGRGEMTIRSALAKRYSAACGRDIDPDQVLCFPGTQTSLYVVLTGLTQAGDEVLVGDPLYATYEGVIRGGGADMVPVPLLPENGFRLRAADLAARITPRTRAILLNTPHNPTGAVLTKQDIEDIGALAIKHDLWIISDEVYDEFIYDGVPFHSPLHLPELAERTVVVSSISKSHAAPGFRSGWAICSLDCANALLPVSETMLFGNQPFIADATALAVAAPSDAAAGMRARFAKRAAHLAARIEAETACHVNRPKAGMFALIDIRTMGVSCTDFASTLLDERAVGVMPGISFGDSLAGWLRLSLTTSDEDLDAAITQIIVHANAFMTKGKAAK